MSEARRYLFSGGGTGGHVTPNLAIIRELREHEPGCRLLYVGSRRGPERRLVQERDVPFIGIPARAHASPRRPLRFALFAAVLIHGTLRSLWILMRYRPHVVVATGGYASAGPVLAAALLRRPIFLHEQNVKPGKANLFLARFAARIGVSFEETLRYFPPGRAVVSGYPVRRRITASDPGDARERLRIPAGQRVAFVLGGSMGARSINRATVEGLEHLLAHHDVTVIHSTGLTAGGAYDAWKDTLERLKGSAVPEDYRSRYILRRYFDQIEDAYAASDLVVARAGAGVVMELAALGKPALLIPKSDGPDNHQLVNALSLKERGSADVLLEEMYEDESGTITRVHGDLLARKINDLLLDAERLEEMSRSARNLLVPDAGPNNAAIVRGLAREERRGRVRSVQQLAGRLVDRTGHAHELVFPNTTIGRGRTADVRLPAGGRPARAVIRRLGGSCEDTEYRLIARRGLVSVDGRVVETSVRLEPGQQVSLGGHTLRFDAEVRSHDLPAARGSVLAKIVATGIGTLASRVSGLVRQVVLAATFGAGAVVDVFAASLAASNLFRRVFAENAVDSVFLPTYLMLRDGGRRGEAGRLFRTVLTASVLMTGILVVAGVLAAPWWLPVLVPGFAAKPGLLADAISLTRVMMPYLTLVTIAAILGAALRAHNRFTAPAYASVMFNVGIILGVALYPWLGIEGLGIGLLAGGVGQVALNLLPFRSTNFRRRSGLGFRPLLALDEPGARKVRDAAPKIVADVTIAKLATVVDFMIVSTLATGLVSVLFYALLIFQLPFALVSQSINTVVLKEFSQSLAARDQEACRRLVTSGLNWTLFLLAPAAVLMMILARPIVDVILHWGIFDAQAAAMVATALACYAVGLPGWGVQALTGRFYAARLEVGQAMLINLGAVTLNVALSLGLVAAGFGFAGVALGTSLAFLANAAFRTWHLNRNLRRDGGGFSACEILPSWKRTLVATAGAALIAFLVLRVVDGFDAAPAALSRLAVLLVPALAAGLSYFGIAAAVGSPEMKEIAARIRRQLPSLPPDNLSRAPLNVYCLRPEQLLRCATRHPDAVRGANLTRRVREFLGKSDWKQKNIGVKLAGSLKIRSLKYELVRIVEDRAPAALHRRLFGADFVNPGFVRRNAIVALIDLESHDEDVERAIVTALEDPYYEVRAMAARAVARYARQLTPPARHRALELLEERVRERNFEVAMNAVVGLRSAALDTSVLTTLATLHYHPNWQVRHEVVRAYYELYRRGVIEDRKAILERLDDVLITCDSFHPSFELKETIAAVRKGLSTSGGGREENAVFEAKA